MSDNPIKVLVVDDEAGLTDAMEKLLKIKGFETFSATDGMQAVELFGKERPQICIIDIQLGYSEIDGIDVLARVKQMDKSAECIMVTRITDDSYVEKAKELEAARYLLKPIDAGDWINVVMEVAGNVKERGESSGESAS